MKYQPDREKLQWMYQTMVLAREYEMTMKRVYLEGKMPVFDMSAGPLPGEMHIAAGQEPCAVGVAAHLQESDWMVASHRPHHLAIAKGVDLNRMTAEIFGRKTGLGGGRGGHMHLSDPAVRFTSTGIVGQALGIANGHALASHLRKSGEVAVGCIGEGGANQGIFHETMNLAALWKLPLICVIEDNKWGVSVSKASSTAVSNNAERAVAYGCAGEYVSNNDVWGVYEAAGRAVERARNGEGPTIIEIETLRLEGHYVGDPEPYVGEEEKNKRITSDPIEVMGRRLIEQEGFDQGLLDEAAENARTRVSEAENFARESEEPAPEDALSSVFVTA